MLSSSATMIRSSGTPRRAARSVRYRGSGGSSDDRVDVIESQPRLAEALVDGLDRRCRESFVDRVRCGEAKHIAAVDETDCGIEVFAFIGNI